MRAALRDVSWLTMVRTQLMPRQPGRVPFHNDAEVALRGYHCSNLRDAVPVLHQVTWSKLPYRENDLHRGYEAGIIFKGGNFAPGVLWTSRQVGEDGPPRGRDDYWFRLPNIYFRDYLEVSTTTDEYESPLSDRDTEYCVRNPNGKQSQWVRFSYDYDESKLLEIFHAARKQGEDLFNAEKYQEAIEPLRKAMVFSRHLPAARSELEQVTPMWNEAIDRVALARMRFREGVRVRLLNGKQVGKEGVIEKLGLRHAKPYWIRLDESRNLVAAADDEVEEIDDTSASVEDES